jgi:hypothetical protein
LYVLLPLEVSVKAVGICIALPWLPFCCRKPPDMVLLLLLLLLL